MNAERLHAIALALKQEMAEKSRIERMRSLVNSLQALVNSPNQSTQTTLASERTAFSEAFTNTPSDSFSPAWRQILIEMDGADLFGNNLRQKVESILASNQMTPAAALTELQQILQRMEAFKNAIDQVIAGFQRFKIGTEQLSPGQAEIGILIPRAAVKNEFGGFADEMRELEFILDSLSQAAGGRKEDLQIKTLSSSGLMVYLLAHRGSPPASRNQLIKLLANT